MDAERQARRDVRTRQLAIVVALIVLVAGILEALFTDVASTDLANVALAVAVGGSLLAGVWWPPVGVAGVTVCFLVPVVVFGGRGPGGTLLTASMLAVAWNTYRSTRARGVVAYLAAALAPSIAEIVVVHEPPTELMFFMVILGTAHAAGYLLQRERDRSDQLELLAAALAREQEATAETAVAEERSRISRELHDAVAHSISVMTLQVGVVRRRLDDRPAEQEQLSKAESVGRAAVDELRHIVGLLRADSPASMAPRPSLAHLDELVDAVQSAGAVATVQLRGAVRPLPMGVDAAAYRVIQESLSNVLRHAPDAAAEVTIDYLPAEVVVAVSNAAPLRRPARSEMPSGGHGLLGLRERTAVFGGTLRAGPRDGGGFEVRATLPVPQDVSVGVTA